MSNQQQGHSWTDERPWCVSVLRCSASFDAEPALDLFEPLSDVSKLCAELVHVGRDGVPYGGSVGTNERPDSVPHDDRAFLAEHADGPFGSAECDAVRVGKFAVAGQLCSRGQLAGVDLHAEAVRHLEVRRPWVVWVEFRHAGKVTPLVTQVCQLVSVD